MVTFTAPNLSICSGDLKYNFLLFVESRALRRSDALIRNFAKRLSTDAAIQAFFCLNCLLVSAVIVMAIAREGTFDKDDDSGGEGGDRPT